MILQSSGDTEFQLPAEAGGMVWPQAAMDVEGMIAGALAGFAEGMGAGHLDEPFHQDLFAGPTVPNTSQTDTDSGKLVTKRSTL